MVVVVVMIMEYDKGDREILDNRYTGWVSLVCGDGDDDCCGRKLRKIYAKILLCIFLKVQIILESLHPPLILSIVN